MKGAQFRPLIATSIEAACYARATPKDRQSLMLCAHHCCPSKLPFRSVREPLYSIQMLVGTLVIEFDRCFNGAMRARERPINKELTGAWLTHLPEQFESVDRSDIHRSMHRCCGPAAPLSRPDLIFILCSSRSTPCPNSSKTRKDRT